MADNQQDCIPKSMLMSMVTTALQRGGASKEVAAQVMQNLEEMKLSEGLVIAFITRTKESVAYISSPYIVGAPMGGFHFPPNGTNFSDELKRAQNEDRFVSVLYTVDASGNNL